MSRPPTKCDIPFQNGEEIAAMVAQFEGCIWPYSRWTHRAHIAVAACYLLRFSFDEAVSRVRHYIQAYNKTCGDPDGYHETITIFYMRLLWQQLTMVTEGTDIADFVNQTAASFPMSFLSRFYSAELLWSPQARIAWVEPDGEPLPF